VKPGTWMGSVMCAAWLAAACAHTGENGPVRAPASPEAEEAPARPVATSLANDPLSEPGAAHSGESHDHQDHGAPGHQHHHGMNHAGSAPVAEAGAPAAVYTCPMHPEVQQAGPGECPKCGMRLVPKKPSGAQAPSTSQAGSAHEHAN
jgi:hypothetical protein